MRRSTALEKRFVKPTDFCKKIEIHKAAHRSFTVIDGGLS